MKYRIMTPKGMNCGEIEASSSYDAEAKAQDMGYDPVDVMDDIVVIEDDKSDGLGAMIDGGTYRLCTEGVKLLRALQRQIQQRGKCEFCDIHRTSLRPGKLTVPAIDTLDGNMVASDSRYELGNTPGVPGQGNHREVRALG